MKQLQKKMHLKKWALAIAFSFFIPILIMAMNYYRLGIYPTSDRTILASDAFGQLVNFYAGFNNLLHNEQSFFYTWSGSLGLNFVSLMSYYVNSLYSFLVIFFDNIHMPDAMYVILLMKIGSMGVSFCIFAYQTFRLPSWIKVAMSISYALMSFTVAYSIMIMWMDAMIYLPLILLGIHQLMDKKKFILLFTTYLLLFVTNYYMAFMVGIFSFLYFVTRSCTNWKQYKSSVIPYLITSFLAGGASMIIILPSIIDLKSNGEKTDVVKTFLTNDVGPWDFVVKSMPGVYDTSKYGSGPFIYIGLLPLLFVIFYFATNKISLKNKLLYGGLLIVLIASVYIQPLNLFWQGMHSPNMFLFRYSFLYSTLVLILAGFGLEKFEKKDLNTLVNSTFAVIGIFILAAIVSNKKRYGYLTQESLIITNILLVLYVFLAILKTKHLRYNWLVPVLFVICVCGEQFFNTQQIMAGINQEWGYTSRKKYTEAYKQIHPLVKEAQAKNKTFHRIENLDPVSRTDSFNYNYSGITLFSSVRNRHSSNYLDKLGYRSPATNLTIQYKNNTILMDDLFGVKYNLSKKDPEKYGFKKIASKGVYGLYENDDALPLGIQTDQGIYQKKNNDNQTALLNYLSGQNDPLFQFTGLKEVSRENMSIREEGDFTYFSEETNSNTARNITWEVNVPAKSQAYLTLDSRGSSGLAEGNVEVSVPNYKTSSELISNGINYNIGYYEKATTVKVNVKFMNSSIVRLLRPSVLILKTEKLDQAIKAIKQKEVIFDVKGNQAKTTINTKKEQVIFTTIPYDVGWNGKIDGKKVELKAVQNALISIKVPKGKHTIQLTYYPKGIKLGSLLFISCILIFGLYTYHYQKKKGI
ncbi:hypothetical protein IGJ02_000495 [Enterococcus sp. DIV0724b]|uniref:YfhO family protein n=1 Tax=Enterococcus sp. DIV0724b TaxID=2774694 RepID=UPI003D2FBC27